MTIRGALLARRERRRWLFAATDVQRHRSGVPNGQPPHENNRARR
jgi:hypothetical protein